MIVGLLSDTHGRAEIAVAAVRLLVAAGAEQLVHCGDVGDGDRDGTAVLDAMAGGPPAVFVFGNNDDERKRLARHAKAVGVRCGDDHADVLLDGKLAVVTHGDDGKFVRKQLERQAADYLFVGHSHQRVEYRQGRVRVVNPGALHRATIKTVAVLDTATDAVRFLTVDPATR